MPLFPCPALIPVLTETMTQAQFDAQARLIPLLQSVDACITALEQAVTIAKDACWGPGDEPLAALPSDWYCQAIDDITACANQLRGTPSPCAVACDGDYDAQP